ncbi:MAG: hypothetical protein IPP22_08745 [Nitrosomonas sp.]|nr:hypothetical protein [Nitrosomonas sp.]
MEKTDCPHTMRMGSHEARISALEKGMEDLESSLESKISRVTVLAENNALKLMEDKAKQSGFIKGMHMTATLIGYSVIIIALLLAGKFTGAIESVLKLIRV